MNVLRWFRNDLEVAMEWLKRYHLRARGDGTGTYWIFDEGYADSVPGSMGRYMGRFILTDILCMAQDLRGLEAGETLTTADLLEPLEAP